MNERELKVIDEYAKLCLEMAEKIPDKTAELWKARADAVLSIKETCMLMGENLQEPMTKGEWSELLVAADALNRAANETTNQPRCQRYRQMAYTLDRISWGTQ